MGLCTSSTSPTQPLADTKGIHIPKSSERLLSLNNALSCAEIFAQLKDASESSLYKALDLMATAPGLDYETLFEGLSALHALASSTKSGFEWDVRGSAPVRIDISDDLLHEIYLRIMSGSPRTILGIMTQKTDEENVSALHIAILHGNDVISQRLLSEGDIDIHAVTHPSRRTTLMCAARVGNLEVLSLLLARGVDINARTATGETALMIGASFCQSRIVRHLLTFLNSDLALELVDSHGRTASDLALAVRDRVQNSAAHVREAWIAESEQNCALFIAAATWNKSQYLHLKRAITNAVPGLLGPLLKTIISFLGRGIRKG